MIHGLIVLFAMVVLLITGCTTAELNKVQVASDVRSQLCAELDTVAALAPEVDLSKARMACQRGDDLKAIAAAYAGCREPETKPAVPVPAEPETPAVAEPKPATEVTP